MSQSGKESYLGQNAWLDNVKPCLTNLKEALTKDLTIYGYQESDTPESSTTYQIGKDGIYCTIQKNL